MEKKEKNSSGRESPSRVSKAFSCQHKQKEEDSRERVSIVTHRLGVFTSNMATSLGYLLLALWTLVSFTVD